MTNEPKLITADKYAQTVIDSIDKAKERVFVLVMILGNDDSIEPILLALKNAAKRGVKVSMGIDTFTLTEIVKPFKFYRSKHHLSITGIRRNLEKSGIDFQWLGNSSFSIISGRTHGKWIIADNTVYTFGGINLYDQALNNVDFMFKVNNSELANYLVREQKRITESSKRNHAYKSHAFKSDYGKVMVDGGLLGDSMIYKRACVLAKKSKKILFVSQYCPSGRLGLALKKANTQLYFNDWRKASPFNALIIRAGALVSGNHSLYDKPNYLHAKYMIF